MQVRWLAALCALAIATSEPAVACIIHVPIDLNDVRHADVVLIGRVSNYELVRNEALRQRELSYPNLPPDRRARYESPQRLAFDYARFEIRVDEIVFGDAPARLIARWDNSTFPEPEEMAAGPFLIALQAPPATTTLRDPSGDAPQNAEPRLYNLLQSPCAGPFLFESTSDEARTARRIVAARGR